MTGKAVAVDPQRVRPRNASRRRIKVKDPNSKTPSNAKGPDILGNSSTPDIIKIRTGMEASNDAATMVSRDSGYVSQVSNKPTPFISPILSVLFTLPQGDVHDTSDDWQLPQLAAGLGVFDQALLYVSKITHIRDVIRQNNEQRIHPIVNYKALYRATELDAGIRAWNPASSGDNGEIIGMLYRQTMWIYLWLTIYPPQITNWKLDPRVTRAVNDGITLLSLSEPEDQTILLTPAFVIGCGAFEVERRQPIRVAIAKSKSHLGNANIDANNALEVLEEVWRLMDERDLRSWDWQSIAHQMGINFSITSTWETSSVASVETLITDLSMSSVNPASVGGAAEEAVEILLSKVEIPDLIAKGFESMAQNRFERNFNRLLKEFATNLRKEAVNNAEKSASKLIHHYRAFMTRTISKRFAGDQSGSQAEAFDDMKKQEASKLMLERLLSNVGDQSASQAEAHDSVQQQEENHSRLGILLLNSNEKIIIQKPDDSPGSVCDESETSGGGEPSLPNLTKVKEFIISSDALVAFAKGLHDFVNPVSVNPQNTEDLVETTQVGSNIVDEDENQAAVESSTFSQIESMNATEHTGGQTDSKPQLDIMSRSVFISKENELPSVSICLSEKDHIPLPNEISSAEESSSKTIEDSVLNLDLSFEIMPTPPAHGLGFLRILKRVITRLKKFVRASPQSGYCRVEWTCGCGESLYADFQNDSIDTINNLATILNSPISPQHIRGSSTGIPLSNVCPTIQSSPSIRFPALSNSGSTSSSVSTLSPSASSLGSSPVSYIPTQSYLEVCVNTGEYTKTLCEIELRDVGCDGELFRRIRKDYCRLRSFRSRFWFLKPSGVHFVRFAVEDPLSVGILQKPLALPPPCEVTSKNYTYTPCPLEGDPPMPQHTFLHLLSCTAYNPKLAWLPRLPRKLNSSILRYTGAVNYGWGIHINEGPDYFIIGVVNFVLLMLSGLAAFLWNWYKSDFQGAFGFAGWIVAVLNGVLVSYVIKWQHE